ncbi:MAG: AAA family ATPase [Treponemataceae bacterium]|nr:AAA family ATPase [Treponemataceae bacterium]
MKKKIPIKTILLIMLILCAAVYVYLTFFSSSPDTTDYSSFYNSVEKGDVISVSIKTESIDYVLRNGRELSTKNPDSPTLKEFLLLHNVDVEESGSFDQLLSTVFDIIFYVFFFGLIIIAFRKFISPNTFKTVHRTGVSFDDVIGMDGLKRDMMQIAEIMKHSEEYKKKGIRMPKGILLEGAPGNGKTLFARALAGEAKVNFIPAKATDFESMFMAIGPLKVKLLFAKARKKAPCIVFIDEFDGIGTKRNYSGSAIETENTRIVTALLNELDGFTQNDGILVLAATNSRAALDEALIRPGRFDAKYIVPYPDDDARRKLASYYLTGKKVSSDCTPEVLAPIFKGFSCAQIESVLNRAPMIASQQGKDTFGIAEVRLAMKEH